MDSLRKITYIISDIDKAVAFEWIAETVNKEKFKLSFILLNPGPSALEKYLVEKGYEVSRIKCNGKAEWPMAIWKTRKLLKRIKPDAVHCHLLQANIIGLTAAKLSGVKKRIYTRHHSSLHHQYHRKGIWWDKLANKLATHIVAISGIVKKILIDWEKVPSAKIVLIPHGFLLDHFAAVSAERISAFRQRQELHNDVLVIGVVSRFTEWKGVQYIIPAFKSLLKKYPDAILLLLNAKGDHEKAILKLVQELPSNNYRVIPFEQDIAAAYHAMNVFVHVPVDEHSEAFGQIYIEALAAGVPSVFTLSGIAPDFITDKENAFVVPFKNSDAIYSAILELLVNKELADQLKINGQASVKEKFALQKMIDQLEELYVR